MEENTDAELVAASCAGSKEAFGDLVERYQHLVERIAQRMLGNAAIAQELAQEAFLQAYLSLDRLRDDARFASWLYGITLNVCRDYLRSQKIDACSLETLMGGMFVDPACLSVGTLDPVAVVEEHELAQTILRSVNALSAAEREATLLFYYAQFRLSEIAFILGISVIAVKGRLHKARKHLKKDLSTLFEETPREKVSRQRSTRMIKVSVIDSVTILNKETAQSGISIVVLYDETQRRAMGIWVGQAEALAISRELRQSPMPRPMTINFIASILQSLGAVLEEVRIETLKDEIFYAQARIRSGNMLHEIDARPSDAIGLAVTSDAPVFVSEEIFEKCGVTLPEGKTISRIGANMELEQSDQSANETLVLEEFTKGEYEKNFRRVLQIMTR